MHAANHTRRPMVVGVIITSLMDRLTLTHTAMTMTAILFLPDMRMHVYGIKSCV